MLSDGWFKVEFRREMESDVDVGPKLGCFIAGRGPCITKTDDIWSLHGTYVFNETTV